MTRSKLVRAVPLIFVLAALAAVPTQGRDLQTVEFYSPAVDRDMKYNILLPDGYEASTARYPVLYLLHGVTQNYTVWGLTSDAPFYASIYDDLIVVMPDAGNSWYVNWAESEDGQSNNWEDHIVRDVVNHVDCNFRTIARREGRAMTGFSMGGFGAITMGLRNPELFISIGSTSGAIERGRKAAAWLRRESRLIRRAVRKALSYGRQAAARLRGELEPRPRRTPTAEQQRRRQPNPLIGIDGFSSQVERTPRGAMFLTPEQADAYDPFLLIKQVARDDLPHIHLYCGTEDGLIAATQELAAYLAQENIPFNYMQMPGDHNSSYAIEAIGHIVSVQYEVMQRALGQRPFGRRAAN